MTATLLQVTLKPCETYNLHTIQSPQDCQSVANSSEALQAIEECIAVWIKQIEQVFCFNDTNIHFQLQNKSKNVVLASALNHTRI